MRPVGLVGLTLGFWTIFMLGGMEMVAVRRWEMPGAAVMGGLLWG